MKRRSHQTRARRGRTAPAPYTKYEKKPYRYSAEYHAWRSRFARTVQSGAAAR